MFRLLPKLNFKSILICLLLLGWFSFTNTVKAQKVTANAFNTSFQKYKFKKQGDFIENKGQYNNAVKNFYNMGTVLYGYEDLGMPVLFTTKGTIHPLQKYVGLSHEEEERLERKGIPEEEIEKRKKMVDRTIVMQWINANPNVKITAYEKSTDYHTYGTLTEKAYGYKKIVYENLYEGIDLIYSFEETDKPGYEYSLVVKPGADVSKIKMKLDGDVKSIKLDKSGKLKVVSDIGGVEVSMPISFYGDDISVKPFAQKVQSAFTINNKEVGFNIAANYDKDKTLIIDPFVTATGPNLTGTNAGKTPDVDFDYAGNIYVSGGSSMIAKYNAAGVLQWTFNGSVTSQNWIIAQYYYGGWVVEKPTGNVFAGQAYNFNGFRVIRLNTNGLYDNFITNANATFQEDWKMIWSCNGGNAQILIAGGGTNSNTNMGIVSPPALNPTGTNLTGDPVFYQDMADMVIDPVDNSMYHIYAAGLSAQLTNRIFKTNAPYTVANQVWNQPSGFLVLGELRNRPYFPAPAFPNYSHNSINALAVNANYLFYWDGKNLKAFNKATGVAVGTPLITNNVALMQGGIVADACNNVFVGEANGVIKVYNFNGTVFSDAPIDIPIPGFAGKGVYDLAYDGQRKYLYASGDGFVASFDVASYCTTTLYNINVITTCTNGTATATLTPAPPAGSIVTYALYQGGNQIAVNNTGIFTGLTSGITYTIVATINLNCSGTQASTTFVLTGSNINVTSTNSTCGANTGSITATGSGSTGPYTYSIDGVNFFTTGFFPNLAAGVYTVTVRDAAGCPSSTTVTITNTNGPLFTFTQTNATCGNNSGTVTVTANGGTPPYQYSSNGGITWQANNFFTGLSAGTYTLMVRDANNCTNATTVTITSSAAVSLTATPSSATCGNSNGTITAFGNGGTAPLQYSINGNTYQAGNVFNGLLPGTYTVYVKDAVGCITTVTNIVVANVAGPTVTAVFTPASCGNINGTITATGTGGIAPYTYSINGGTTYQASNVFAGLAAGPYTITIRDNTGCTNTVSITVTSSNGPQASATVTAAACGANNGIITITGTGGTAPYNYSINGTTYFPLPGNIFNGLAAGNYIAYVRDVTGCISTVPVTITQSAAPTITATVTPTSCVANTGSITAIGSGGTLPYTYSIDGVTFGAANVFPNLAQGTYTVYVRDANNCTRSINVTVLNISNLSLAASAINASCGNNGTITATATGGVAPLQYSINGTVYQAGNIFNGVTPGVYTVYVRDANNCIATKQVTVGNAAILSLTVIVPVQATCGTVNAVIRATGSGGVAPLQYSINGTVYQNSGTFLDVAPGTYTVYVRDAAGCIVTLTNIVVTNSTVGTPINTFTVVADYYPCDGDVTGKITNPKVNNATCNTCTYSLDFGAYIPHATQLFLGVAPGIHYVTARNTAGCTKTIQVNLAPSPLATVTTTVTGTTCNGNTGSITVTGVGPNTPYHVSRSGVAGPWFTFDPTYTFNGLAPGVYYIISADDASFTSPPDNPGGCLDTVIVTVPLIGAGPTVAVTSINPSCNTNTGSITATGNGGTAPYTYSINGGAFTAANVFNNLFPGNYNIQVRDNTNCTSGTTVNLAATAIPAFTTVLLPATCNINNGTITVNATGIGPFEYSINGTVYQTSNVFTGLAAGTYTVFVRNSFNCFVSQNITITTVARVLVSAYSVPASCNNSDGSIVATGSLGTLPYTFSLDGTVYQSSGTFTNLAAGAYTVYIKDDRGCISTIGVSINNFSGPTITNTTTTNATCGNATGSITVTASGGIAPLEYSRDGITFQASNIFGTLPPGNYTVTVRDANGCIALRTVSVGNINGSQTLNAAVVDASCGNNNGSITLSATGGTAPLQYSINGTVYQAGALFPNLPAGTYTVYVRDANLCVLPLNPVVIANLAAPVITLAASPASCGLNDGTITVTATGGTGIIQYSINGGAYQSSNIFLGLAAGTYTITARDAKLCVSAPVVIIVTTIGAAVTPTFNPVAPICSGATLAPLPTTSLNGITGTWAPALNNTATTTYTFTPTAGLCATTTTLTINVTANITPTFNPVAAICAGAVLAPLPTTSLNGITGTWAPALNNTATTTYTFTPAAGQCATIATLTITVNANVTPTFNPVAPICTGAVLAPLPTASLNGITGTWTPALNNTATTTYAFTPTAGQCATTTTLTITVNANVTPTFNPVAAICAGGALVPLPTTSLNGITGTWTPALNNTVTTTYTFTPTVGQCATTTILTITVNAAVTPTFNPVTAICAGGVLAPLPTTSLNGITGTWAPALNNTTTTTYTFTPTVGQCATTTTLTITVNPILNSTINCGVSTTNSVTFNWVAVAGATGYNVSYIINAGAPVNIGTIGNLLMYTVNGLTGGNTVTITVTPTGGAGTCFAASTQTCTATACTPPTAAINYSSPFCANIIAIQAVTLTGTGAFTGGVYSAAPAGLTINAVTGAITPNTSTPNVYTVTYTVAPSGGCPGVTATTSVTITASVIPTFNPVAAICSAATLNPLPTTSLNGITGTWAPALNNTATTTYTFTPATGECATTTTLIITVNAAVTPTFNAVAPICSGTILAPLPTTSLNGITGTWTPALNNTATTIYTFTPAAGQCATTTTLTITVNPILSLTINCGISTTNSVTFNWAAVAGATGYTVSYTINAGAPVNIGVIGNLLTYTVNGLAGGNTVTITVTPTGGAGTCFAASTQTCTANTCTPPTAAISYNGPFCVNVTTVQAVTLTGTGVFTGGTYSAAPAGLTINATTGAVTPATSTPGTYTVTYTITPSGGCAGVTATATLVISPKPAPTLIYHN